MINSPMPSGATMRPRTRTVSRLLGIAALATLLSGIAPAQIPMTVDLDGVRALPVQHDGRWPPLDTLARDLVWVVTGERRPVVDPVAQLLAWAWDPQTWGKKPLIPIRSAELRAELGLPENQTVFSYLELLNHPGLAAKMNALHRTGGRKLDPLEQKVQDIEEKLSRLQSVFTNEAPAIRPVPDPRDALGAWKPIPVQLEPKDPELKPVRESWLAMRQAFLADDAPAFAAASDKLLAAIRKLPAATRPDPDVIRAELTYNRTGLFRSAWILMVVGAVLAGVALRVRQRWFDVVAVLPLIAGFVVETYALSLRWTIAGRIPAANMYESLLFLSWGMGAFAILGMIVQRHRLVPLTASFMGALSLLLSDVLPMDGFVRPIAPVLLDTVWMSIHVPIIMVSYSVLALAVLVAHVQVFTMALGQERSKLCETLDRLHYWYIHVGSILLTIGILTGSMWAASSWGRYWGWDPKEVWSLVALLGYMTILHVRLDNFRTPRWLAPLAAGLITALLAFVVPTLAPLTPGKILALGGAIAAMIVLIALRGRFATAFKSILCFWLILMTYLGVNYLLGTGLHSYGFGTGAVARSMIWAGTIDLAFVLVGGGAYLLHRSAAPPATAVPTAAAGAGA